MKNTDVLTSYIQISHGSSLEIVISRTIVDFGIPPHVRGYQYIREALMLLLEDENKLFGITKDLYPVIARKYLTTPARVERAIRHAIEISWDGHSKYSLRSYFTDSSTRPTNSCFLEFLQKSICYVICENDG